LYIANETVVSHYCSQSFSYYDDNNNNNHDDIYGVVIMAEPFREFTGFTR